MIALTSAQAALAEQPVVLKEELDLNIGESLIVHSEPGTIQRVFVEGNLSSANITKPTEYPANDFELAAFNPGSYELRVLFDNAGEYTVHIFVKNLDSGASMNSTTYYFSGGPSELDINATFNTRPDNNATVTPSISPWDSFVNWMGKFGQAFPAWVKLLYLVLGIQFFAVGGLWIRRETARKESGTQRLDAGDKAFLWLDVAYKFLLVSFVTIVVIMGGELLILFILRFMFLVSLDLLSLWDLFVVGFAAGVVIMVYLIRFTLERAFDLKPMEDE